MQMPVQNQQARQLPAEHTVRRTRLGALWTASALFAIVLVLLLVFILENGSRVDISFLGAHAHLPLGVALLLAAVLGILLVAIPGTGRIVQLRVTARRHRQLDAGAGVVPGTDAPVTDVRADDDGEQQSVQAE
jgi:lipopolysaccharide assembly protein A